ncbi:MAG: T9SS type A sorting domain-containing protein [Schleiferiaceae bacterium]|nr:T9SS type A sorting domain-containing protein [Schleiferiaceae bacterium]
MKKTHSVLALLFFLFVQITNGQTRFEFEFYGDYPVVVNGDTLKNPWAGGLIAAQFSSVDLNDDGLEDLVVLDKFGNRPLTYIRTPHGNSFTWVYDQNYARKFPEVRGFIIFQDYDCDGKKDLFTQGGNGIGVYRNTSQNGNLSFEWALGNEFDLKTQLLVGPTVKQSLTVPSTDLPIIEDVDGDGIIDILTFGPFGSFVQMHKGLTACELDFAEVNDCWGEFIEDFLSSTIILDHCLNNKTTPIGSNKTQHAGAAMCVLDLTNNGLKDLLLTDIDNINIKALFNTGTQQNAHITSLDNTFPSYDLSITLDTFPAASYLDLDFDGVKDLGIGTFTTPSIWQSRNTNNVQFYKNVGSNTSPLFQRQDTAFLQRDMIKMGERTYPVLFDVDEDGLIDLIVTNYSERVVGNSEETQYHFYKNVGTVEDPLFTLITKDFGSLSQLNLGKLPMMTFGDLTGDGKLEVVVGKEDGTLDVLQNTGTVSTPVYQVLISNLNGIDVGHFAAPYLFDVSGDSTLDLLIGNQSGTISYYRQVSQNPLAFNLVTNRFGGVDTRSRLNIGASNPVMFYYDDRLHLFVGSHSNGIYHYDSIQRVIDAPAAIIGEWAQGNTPSTNHELTPFGTTRRTGRNQFIIRASELHQEGFIYGIIDAISFQVTTIGNPTITNGVTLSMKHTSANSVTDFDNSGFQQVNHTPLTVTQGWNRIPFQQPFQWNEIDNILVEICFERNLPGNDIHVNMHDAGFPAHGYGDITNFNTLLAKGCEMPFKQATNMRPNFRLDMVPRFYEVDRFLQSGHYNYVAVAELNNDDYPEIVQGNLSGGVQFFKGVEFDYTFSVEQPATQRKEVITVYPNPTSGWVQLVLPETPFEATGTITVTGLDGKSYFTKDKQDLSQPIDLRGLSNGVYILQVTTAKQVWHTKVILER